MEIIHGIRETPRLWAVRILAAACVVLSVISLALAVAWKAKADEAACWRAAFEEDDTRAAQPCA